MDAWLLLTPNSMDGSIPSTSTYLAMSEDYLNMSKETPEQEANRILELSNRLSSIAVEGIDLLLDDESDDEC